MLKYFYGITVLAFSVIAFTACDDTNSAKNEGDNTFISSSSEGGFLPVSSSSEEILANSSSSEETLVSSSSEVTEQCTEVFACDAIVKGDFSTWNFIRKDSFGDDMQYIYSVDGKSLILTTIDSEGNEKVNSNSYAMYDMTTAASQEMAFNAVKSTCVGGRGNDRMVTVCE
jgi:hypothetical protein